MAGRLDLWLYDSARSSRMEFAPRARENMDKSLHPDLQVSEDGSLGFRPDVFDDPRRREFNRMASDPARWAAFYGQVAREQAELPPEVQEAVAGRNYEGGRDMFDNFQEYLQDIRHVRSYTEGGRAITSRDVERMSLEEYDKHFDEHGRPREGVRFYPTGRDVDVSGRGIDPFSELESRSNR